MKSIKMFGKSVPLLTIVIVSVLVFGASAALLTYYGTIEETATVLQSVLVDGKGWGTPIIQSFGVIAGNKVTRIHTIENRAEVPAEVEFASTYDPNNGGVTATYTTEITDDNIYFGSQNNEVVDIPFTPGLTLNQLFAGEGLKYTYTVLAHGSTYVGDAPVIAVIDLDDGRHIILFPGWGPRAVDASFTLQFSETVAHDSGGNNYVDFSLQPAGFGAWLYGSGATYGDFEFVRTDCTLIGGSEVVTRIAIQHQAANTGQKDRLDSVTVDGVTYNFIEMDVDQYELGPGEMGHFVIRYDFLLTAIDPYTITTTVSPLSP